jgi:hypothetical protein
MEKDHHLTPLVTVFVRFQGHCCGWPWAQKFSASVMFFRLLRVHLACSCLFQCDCEGSQHRALAGAELLKVSGKSYLCQPSVVASRDHRTVRRFAISNMTIGTGSNQQGFVHKNHSVNMLIKSVWSAQCQNR